MLGFLVRPQSAHVLYEGKFLEVISLSNMRNTCIIYCRVSYADQVEGTGLETQERLCREYAEQHNLTVLRVFIEPGRSAKTADRAELVSALAYCKKQRVGYFVIHKVDRLARWQEDHHMLKATLRRSGTILRSASEPIGDTPEGRFVEGVLSASAQYDNEIRGVRCKQGMLEHVRRGKWVWLAPLGYMRTESGGNIVPDPETAPLVRVAFEKYATGMYTFQRLADDLTKRGLRTRSGRQPDAQAIADIIRNPLYCGIIKVWERTEGSFPPLVSKELHAACQAILQERSPLPKPHSLNNPEFPLRGFIRCAECSRAFTGSCPRNRAGEHYPYYHHYLRECNLRRFIPKAELEQRFTNYLDSLAFAPEQAEAFGAIVLEVAAEGRASAQRQNATIRRQLAALHGQQQQLFDLHRTGVYTDEDFRAQRQVLDERIQQKTLLLREETGSDAELQRLLEATVQILVEPAAVWRKFSSDYTARIEFQRQLIPDGLVYDGRRLRTALPSEGLRTADSELIYRTNGLNFSAESYMVDYLTRSWNQLLDELRKLEQLAKKL
jgi:site-specific DNA recombinase